MPATSWSSFVASYVWVYVCSSYATALISYRSARPCFCSKEPFCGIRCCVFGINVVKRDLFCKDEECLPTVSSCYLKQQLCPISQMLPGTFCGAGGVCGAAFCLVVCPGTSEQMLSKHILSKGAKQTHCEAAALWNVFFFFCGSQMSKTANQHVVTHSTMDVSQSAN